MPSNFAMTRHGRGTGGSYEQGHPPRTGRRARRAKRSRGRGRVAVAAPRRAARHTSARTRRCVALRAPRHTFDLLPGVHVRHASEARRRAPRPAVVGGGNAAAASRHGGPSRREGGTGTNAPARQATRVDQWLAPPKYPSTVHVHPRSPSDVATKSERCVEYIFARAGTDCLRPIFCADEKAWKSESTVSSCSTVKDWWTKMAGQQGFSLKVFRSLLLLVT